MSNFRLGFASLVKGLCQMCSLKGAALEADVSEGGCALRFAASGFEMSSDSEKHRLSLPGGA